MFAEWASDNDGNTCSFGEQQRLIGSVSVCKLISMDLSSWFHSRTMTSVSITAWSSRTSWTREVLRTHIDSASIRYPTDSCIPSARITSCAFRLYNQVTYDIQRCYSHFSKESGLAAQTLRIITRPDPIISTLIALAQGVYLARGSREGWISRRAYSLATTPCRRSQRSGLFGRIARVCGNS
jgi:hypothetical protein